MMAYERADEVRSMVSRYVLRTGGRNALHNDPQYAAEIHQLARIFEMIDMAMENEDIPKLTRDRVIRACVFGAPDYADAEARMVDREEQIKVLIGKPMEAFWGMKYPFDGGKPRKTPHQ
jgi:hypothetical protein